MGSLLDQNDAAAKVAVIMVPFPAQGHLNQLMQLSCLLSRSWIQVHYIGSSVHNRQARARVNGLSPQDLSKIHFHDIPIPSFESPSPNPDSSSKFPGQLQPAWDASLSQWQPVFEFLRETAEKYKRIVVIHDPMMALVVHDVASIPNAIMQSRMLSTVSIFTMATHIFERMGKRLPFELPKERPPFEGCISNGFLITEILKVGIVAREWDPSGEVVKASTIANVVKTMMASEDGEEIRKRAEKLGAALRQSTEESGISWLEFDSFVAHINRV